MMRRFKQRGMALISALMVLVILAIIAGSFAIVMTRDSRQSRISSYQIVCLNAAQAGIDYAVWLHKHNLAFYPIVDYKQSTSPDNELPVRNFMNSTLYSFPAKGSIYNLPKAGLTDSSGSKYNPVADRRGQYKNETSSNKNWDTEYMFVNDLSFWSDPNRTLEDGESVNNFMHDTLYCVTFQIRESVTTNSNGSRVLHIVSTGKMRYVPENYRWNSQDDWMNFMEKLSQGTTGTLNSKRLEDMGFKEYASRTISSDFEFSKITGTGSYPRAINSYDENLPDNRQNQMPERNKREWFR